MISSAPDLSAELLKLCTQFPLPEGWSVPECFVDSTSVEGLTVHVVGLLGRSEDGREATGSAGCREHHPLSRAYFELLERSVVLDAERRPSRDYELFESASPVGYIAAVDALRLEAPEASFSYSRSNGVAAGSSWNMACDAARAELVERDRVLRSWYGQTCPVRRELESDPAFSALEPYYDFEAYTFPEIEGHTSPDEYEVVGVFGFPKLTSVPLICGMAAASDGALAFSKAFSECLQRWAFLWGETIPDLAPAFAKSADYHQELYLWPAMHGRLRAWLSGGHLGGARARPNPTRTGVRFIALERRLDSGISVAKAMPGAELPLVFGSGHPAFEEPLAAWLEVHPIA